MKATSPYGQQSKARIRLLKNANTLAMMASMRADLMFYSGAEGLELAAYLRSCADRIELLSTKLQKLPTSNGEVR